MKECARCTSSVYHALYASIYANVVIGVLVALRELRVTRVSLVVHAVVGLTLGLITHVVVVVVFVVAILHSHFSVFGGILFTPTVGDSKLLLAVTELITVTSASNSF